MFLRNKFNYNFENAVPVLLVIPVCTVLTFSDKGVVLNGQQRRVPKQNHPSRIRMQFFSESLCILWGSGELVLLIVVGVTLNNGSNLYSLEANS